MQSRAIIIYVYHGKAYLPTQVKFESGIRADAEPVYTANLTLQDLVHAAEKVLTTGEARLPDPTREEWRRRKSPTLDATKARSWKELERSGASYSVAITDALVRVDVSRLDEMGQYQFDPAKARIFPPDTPLQDIMQVILDDIQSRPELR